MQSFSKLGTQSRKINGTSKVTQQLPLPIFTLTGLLEEFERVPMASAVKGAHIRGLPSLCCPITMLAPTTVSTAFLTSQQQTQMSTGLLSGPSSPYCAPPHPPPPLKTNQVLLFSLHLLLFRLVCFDIGLEKHALSIQLLDKLSHGLFFG